MRLRGHILQDNKFALRTQRKASIDHPRFLCFPSDSMELRKDPITRSWVIVGDDVERQTQPGYCPFCPGSANAPQVIATLNSTDHAAGPVTAMVHPAPLYRIEGEPHRHAEGIY